MDFEQDFHSPSTFDWPHAPAHRLGLEGAYMVTAGTYQKQHLFDGGARLSYLTKALLVLAQEHGLRLQAWSVFANHYHLIAEMEQSGSVVSFIRYLHSISAKYVNRLDETPGRKVWHQYWDTHLTYRKSYFARLNYVHTNPVRHKLVANPELYEWCSASWFANRASRSFYETIMNFPSGNIAVPDDYNLIV
jgi:putative transposase